MENQLIFEKNIQKILTDSCEYRMNLKTHMKVAAIWYALQAGYIWTLLLWTNYAIQTMHMLWNVEVIAAQHTTLFPIPSGLFKCLFWFDSQRAQLHKRQAKSCVCVRRRIITIDKWTARIHLYPLISAQFKTIHRCHSQQLIFFWVSMSNDKESRWYMQYYDNSDKSRWEINFFEKSSIYLETFFFLLWIIFINIYRKNDEYTL